MAEDNKMAVIRQTLIRSQAQIVKALPNNVNPDRMFRVYMTAVQTTPKIALCDPISIVGVVMQSAQFGLSLDPVMGESFIIPRNNRKLGRMVAQFQMGYKGLRKLALQGSDDLRDIFADVAYAGDIFEWQKGQEPKILRHVPARPGSKGDLEYAFAVAVWKDGYRRPLVLDREEVENARDSSDAFKYANSDKGFKDSPWHTHTARMWEKTALRALCNDLPLRAEVYEAMSHENLDGKQAFVQAGGGFEMQTEDDEEPAATVVEPSSNGGALDAAADAAEAKARKR